MTIPAMGMVLIRKPEGSTSFQTLSWYKKHFGTTRLGHTGTLDKFATGLMVVLVGSATRLAPWIVLADKTYRARVRFGLETATLDPEGAVVAEAPLPSLSDIEAVLPAFRGDIMQAPPAYSAIHLDGKRAYERVLAGEEVRMEARPVTVKRLEVLSWDGRDLEIEVDCSKGTYIRSLARDIARAAGSVAHLAALDRSRVGPYVVGQAHSPADPEPPRFLPVDQVLAGLEGFSSCRVSSSDEELVRHGKPFVPAAASPCALVSDDGRLLALMEQKEGRWSYCLVLPW